MYKVEIYDTANGKEPYVDWLENLDATIRARVKARITRIRETRNLGKYDPVGEGVFEFKFDFGSGYRVYFGFENETLVILLIGGDKKTQIKDIKKAKEYWKECLSQKGES